MLLKALAPAVRRLPGDKIFQGVHLCCAQSSGNAALRHTPELPIPAFHGEYGGMYLSVDAVGHIVPVHEAAFRFLRHPIFDQRRRDLILIAP